jgi:hypothetical protein
MTNIRPLVHSPMVPVWGDEFDMRLYFSRIHPRQFGFQNGAEYVLAKQLYATVVAFGICHVGIYRAAIRGSAKRGLLKASVRCVRTARRLGIPHYFEWYQRPQPGFAGLSPKEWFLAKQQLDLADLLGMKSRVEEADILTEVQLVGVPEGVDRSRLEQKDDFDLEPYFARWTPANYRLGSDRNHYLAHALYDPMTAEFSGWIRLYSTVLEATAPVDGALEASVRCCMKLVELGREAYLQWYNSTQAEFGGLSPRQWFEDRGLTRLGIMFEGAQ